MSRSRNDDMRRKILEAALRLFLEKGYDNVQKKEIALEVGITPSLLQHYFSLKEELLIDIIYTIVYWTSEYARTLKVPESEQDDLSFYVHIGVFYHLFYANLCHCEYKLLKLYTAVLFNAPLLQNGLSISDERLHTQWAQTLEEKDFRHYTLNYVLNGTLSQLIASYFRNSVLLIPYSTIVNSALSAAFRYVGLTEELEGSIFKQVDRLLTPQQLSNFFQYSNSHLEDFIL